ncbi:transcription factor-like protein DPB [Papaver somniferum]|uniref:transcription factor-like protein DPB n=1 Tax=Papaver somniferum TaxID=3469 RepID=UPI000E704EC9|nr:transcription factor-like protein DPB [Papaver somniferum]
MSVSSRGMVTEGCSYVSGTGDVAAGVGGKSTLTTSTSVGFSPSSKTFNKFNLQAEYDDPWSAGNNNKKKAQTRAVGGLRQFSIQVCKKVESEARITYKEVIDELVAELSTTTPYMKRNYNEKNIRRRVYDSLNVLIAEDIISKDKNKEIQWRGTLHAACLNAVEHLKSQYLGLRNKIANKAAYLEELENQFVGLQNMVQRNKQLCCSGRKSATSGGVSLPFIIIHTPTPAKIRNFRGKRRQGI